LSYSIIKVGDYPENTFEPNRMITREEIARMTIRALGKDAEGVKSGYLAVAKKLEIMKGYPDGSMGGEKKATRAEAVVMILNTLMAKNGKPVAYPKTKEELNTLIQSLPSFKGNTTFGRNQKLLVNQKGTELFEDSTLTIEYDNDYKQTFIYIFKPTDDNKALIKDILKIYYPVTYEKTYSAYIKANHADYKKSNFKTSYDKRSFEVYKSSDEETVCIVIGA